MIYGREAIHRFRKEQQQTDEHQAHEADLLSQIPADAPMDGATLTVWKGERWVAWDKWLATAPIIVEDLSAEEAALPKKEAAAAADSRPRGSNQQRGLW